MSVISGHEENISSPEGERLLAFSAVRAAAADESEPVCVSDRPYVGGEHTWTPDEVADRVDEAFESLRDSMRLVHEVSEWDALNGSRDVGPALAAAKRQRAAEMAVTHSRLTPSDRRRPCESEDDGLTPYRHPLDGAPISMAQLFAEIGCGQPGDSRDLSGWHVEVGHCATWPVNLDRERRERGSFRKKCKVTPSRFTEMAIRDEATGARSYALNSHERAYEALSWLMAEPDGEARRMVVAFGRSRLTSREFCLKNRHALAEFNRIRRNLFRIIAERLNRNNVAPTPARTSRLRFGPGVVVGAEAVAEEYGVALEAVYPLMASGEKPITMHNGVVIGLRLREKKPDSNVVKLPKSRKTKFPARTVADDGLGLLAA